VPRRFPVTIKPKKGYTMLLEAAVDPGACAPAKSTKSEDDGYCPCEASLQNPGEWWGAGKRHLPPFRCRGGREG